MALVFYSLVLRYYKQMLLVSNTLHVNLKYSSYVPLLGDLNFEKSGRIHERQREGKTEDLNRDHA